MKKIRLLFFLLLCFSRPILAADSFTTTILPLETTGCVELRDHHLLPVQEAFAYAGTAGIFVGSIALIVQKVKKFKFPLTDLTFKLVGFSWGMFGAYGFFIDGSDTFSISFALINFIAAAVHAGLSVDAIVQLCKEKAKGIQKTHQKMESLLLTK